MDVCGKEGALRRIIDFYRLDRNVGRVISLAVTISVLIAGTAFAASGEADLKAEDEIAVTAEAEENDESIEKEAEEEEAARDVAAPVREDTEKGHYIGSIYYSDGRYYADENLTVEIADLSELSLDLVKDVVSGEDFNGFFISNGETSFRLSKKNGALRKNNLTRYLDTLMDAEIDSIDAVAKWGDDSSSSSLQDVIPIRIEEGIVIYYYKGKFYADRNLTIEIKDLKDLEGWELPSLKDRED